LDYPSDPLSQLRAWVQCGAACVSDDGRGCDWPTRPSSLPRTITRRDG
jgi:hypothetical protein